MSTIRVNNTKGFTVMSNYHLQDKEISLKAKGLLSLMLSLPSNWDYSVAGLVAIVKENKTSVQSALKELEEAKYLKRTKVQNSMGRFDYIYDIYEKPHDKIPWTENLDMENLCTDNQCTENVSQINTNKQNTKELNTNRLNTNTYKEKNIKKESVTSTIISYTENKDLIASLLDFSEMRTKIKKPLTVRAMKLSLKELDKLAVDDKTKIEIVNQSIMHGWQTFYKLQNNNGSKHLTRAEMGYAF